MKNPLAILQNKFSSKKKVPDVWGIMTPSMRNERIKQDVLGDLIRDLERKYKLTHEDTGCGDRDYFYNCRWMFTTYGDGETGEIAGYDEPISTIDEFMKGLIILFANVK